MLLKKRDWRRRRGVAGESLIDTPAAGVTAATMLVVSGAPHRARRVHAHVLPTCADVDPKGTFFTPARTGSARFRRSKVCYEDCVASIGSPGGCRAHSTAAVRKAPHERPPAGRWLRKQQDGVIARGCAAIQPRIRLIARTTSLAPTHHENTGAAAHASYNTFVAL